MSAPFIIPFNNNPSSTSIKTASYTIPAGKYAYIIPCEGYSTTTGLNATNTSQTKNFLNSEVSLTVDGASVAMFPFRFSGSVTRTSAGSVSYTINFPDNVLSKNVSLTASSAGGTAPSIGVKSLANTITGVNNFFSGILSSVIASISSSVSGTFTGTYDVIVSPNYNNTGFWVPSGSVIGIPTNCSVIVNEYNQIS